MSPRPSIAHYRITSKLGEGGMGEVWRATDTKLGRDVAVKILPQSFAEDPERLARLTREAQVLASLNHPNIAAIYGVEQGALVIELVEGPTLADRIAAGPIPVDETLRLARQIAEALEAAHAKGVIHRDLKPANIKLAGPPDAVRVKVLDFGLATFAPSTAAAAPPSNPSATITIHSTASGLIVGTPGYMSPEQARGHGIDKRADIWAFGVVLFEMLTGREMFAGDTVSDAMAAVLRAELEWSALPPETPAAIRRLLRRCVERDRSRRLADMADARLEIEEALSAPEPVPAAAKTASPRIWIATTAALSVALAAAAFGLWTAGRPVPKPLQRFDTEFDPPSTNNPLIALSPDGSRIVFLARDAGGSSRLHVRLIDQGDSTPLPGTEGARDPFFSPDGQWIAFGGKDGLMKVPLQGGAAVKICDTDDLRGGSWGEDGYIVFAGGNRSALSRVPAAGGIPQPLTQLEDGEISHRHPQVLPGAHAVLYTAGSQPNAYDDATIQIRFLKSGETRVVHKGGYYARFLPGGYLAWVHQDRIYAAPMDPARGALTGEPFAILDNVGATSTRGVGHFAFSPSGLFAALSGVTVSKRTLEWLDPNGQLTALAAAPAQYSGSRFSPDGKRVALHVGDAGKVDISIYETQSGRLSPLTFTGAAADPVWTPDGKHLVFVIPDRYNKLGWIRADGSSRPETLLGRQESMTPVEASGFTPDGKRLFVTATAPQSGRDVWTVPLDWTNPEHPIAGRPEPLLHAPGPEESATVSPDGHWLAYTAADSVGTPRRIYVQPYPLTGGKWVVSDDGAASPVWSRSGKELFFLSEEGRIMAVSYRVEGSSFVAARPRAWASAAVPVSGGSYDIAPDGKRAILVRPGNKTERATRRLTFLLNLPDELRRRAGR